MKDIQVHTCSSCGGSCSTVTGTIYSHRLSTGLVGVLIKFRRAIKLKGENSIHLQRDMFGENELTKTEYANAQKLRFHGLIAHDLEAGAGFWLLTRRGRQFLDGEISVARSVKTLNNAVYGHDERMVYVREVTGNTPEFDDWSYWHSTGEAVNLELAQTGLAL